MAFHYTGGSSRARLGIELTIRQCNQIGYGCHIIRDAEPPRNVELQPCCDYLVCTGAASYQISIQAPNPNAFVGMCTLNLDNNQAVKDRPNYISYVKAQ